MGDLKAVILSGFIVGCMSFPTMSQEVGTVTGAQVDTTTQNAAAQVKINGLDDATDDVVVEYKSVLTELESIRVYNTQLEKLIASQNTEMASLNDQIDRVSTLERDVIPLMLSMVDALKQFVGLDVPFLGEERSRRLAGLDALMVRSDASNAEKYRRLMEAFQIENEYGRTIEAYKGDLDGRTVDFLRIGRVGLIYQTLDSTEAGVWDQNAKTWVLLDESYRTAIRQGLRVARKQAAPDLLILPTPAPEEAS